MYWTFTMFQVLCLAYYIHYFILTSTLWNNSALTPTLQVKKLRPGFDPSLHSINGRPQIWTHVGWPPKVGCPLSSVAIRLLSGGHIFPLTSILSPSTSASLRTPPHLQHPHAPGHHPPTLLHSVLHWLTLTVQTRSCYMTEDNGSMYIPSSDDLPALSLSFNDIATNVLISGILVGQ